MLALLIVFYSFFDQSVALWCHTHLTQDDKVLFEFISKFGDSQYYLISSIIMFILAHYYLDKPALANLALLILAAVIVSGLTADILKFVLGRYRPSELFEQGLYGFTLFQTQRSMTSFPSGHTATVFALATVFVTLWPRISVYAWTFAILAGLSRVVLEAHFPSDVLAGALVGIFSTHMLLLRWNPSRIFQKSRYYRPINR